MDSRKSVLIASMLVVFSCHTATAMADPFERGGIRGSVVIGSGRAFDESYTVYGVSAGYFFARGFEAGMDAEWWTGGERDISKFSPQVRYVANLNGPIRPYVGGFYRYTNIEDLDDLESAGYRLGAYLLTGSNAYLSAGVVQEYYLDCDDDIYGSCDDSYVEMSVGITF